jgi:metal-responsive CopG/Arc/MetJ family transcriptional regulator
MGLLDLIRIMPTKQPVVTMIFPKELLERVEDYRYENRIPTRTEALRQLLEKGLKQYEKKTKK